MSELAVISEARGFCINQSAILCKPSAWCEDINLETFEDSEFQMPGKSFHHASKAKGKGCGIFSDDSKQCVINEKIVEDKFTAMSIIEDSVQLILLYISSHCPLDDVRQALLQMLRPDMVQIITGDFNFDASEENNLTRQLRTLDFEQVVIGPIHDDGIIGIARSPILARCKSAICWPQCWWLTPCRPV